MKVYVPKIGYWKNTVHFGVYSSEKKALEAMAKTCNSHEPGCRQVHHAHTIEIHEVDNPVCDSKEYIWNEEHTALVEGYIQHDLTREG